MSTRDQYVESLKNQLDEWNTQLDRMEKRIQEMEGDARRRYESQISDLRDKMNAVLKKLGAVQTAETGSWEGVKADAEQVRHAFVSSFNYFKSQLPAAEEKDKEAA